VLIEPREHFWNIHLIWLFYVLSFAAILVFAIGAVRALRRWRSGWWPARERHRDAWVPEALAGAGIFKGDVPGGLAHLLTLWGFVVLFVGTTLLAIDQYLITFLTGKVWLAYSLILDLFGAGFVLALAWLLFRRHVLRRRLLYREEPEDSLLLVHLLIVGISGFLVEGLRLAQTTPTAGDWSPVGAMLARYLPAGALTAHRVVWWLHAVFSLLLIVWIPFGKIRHLLTSPLHRFVASRSPVIRTAEEREQATAAFGIHEMLASDACTRCNRCENACPSTGVAEALSPRRVVLDLARASRAGLSASQRTSASPEEIPWLCTSCGACRAACPIRIDAADLIRETRAYVVEQGTAVPDGVARALDSIAKHGNPWEGKRSKRALWAEGLGLRDFSGGDSASLLWWPGCTLAYETRCQELSRATARLLSAAGVDFMIPGKKESNTGDLARRCGEDGLFEMMLEGNVALITETAASGVIVSSPHDWHALAFEYPRLVPRLADVEATLPPARHVTEVLAQKIEEGALHLAAGPRRRIAFHDPCYLGRHHGVFDAPRAILRAIPGTTLVEMQANRESSLCCGGGGGRMWFEPEQAGGLKMSERRARQAVDAGAEVLATACPWCLIQFEDAVKTAGLEDRLRVADVTELAAEVLNG
jgi:Fe-S oxidoreductase